MVSAGLEILGLGLCVIGSLLVMVVCGLPMWKVTAFIEANIVVAQTIWDGLWMSCVVQSTGQMQCKVHDSVLALGHDLQAARALTVISCCTNCISAENVKTRVVNAGGVIYITSGLFVLVPLCWMANNIISDFYNPQVPASKKREIGAALYIGWAATALLLIGGALLCCSCPSDGNSGYSAKYSPTKRATPNGTGDYDKRNYV
ncbi:unnamed protein product [Oncorhynchus mykiss]|uniref:Claudin n=1 Tax=Oncorhynchus mykiss TaxID=8022 RepID=A0A060X5Z1_ONCMY|nr:unnamed protein product [Oncorhynchus mykiss]